MARPFDPRLYLVTDRVLSRGRPVEQVVSAALRGGATAVQLREKAADTREFVDLARRLVASGVPLIINDRVDVAMAAGAAGVHLGRRDMRCADARRLLGPDAVIGLSVETEADALEAEREDADYLGVSPVFPTPTKTDVVTSWGLEGLRRLRARTRRVLVAIGGINASNAGAVLDAGADGLAVVSAISSADDPEAAARALRHIIDRHGRRT